MEIEDIRLFTEIVTYGSISKAARRNDMTQQTLSRRLARMERETGHQLFERTTPLVPTPAGTVFLHRAYELLSIWRQTVREMDRASVGGGQVVKVKQYVTQSFYGLVTRTMQSLQTSHPEIQFSLIAMNEDDQRLVADGLIDIGFVRHVSYTGGDALIPQQGIVYVELASNKYQLGFGVPDGHPLLRMDKPTLADISAFHLALPSFEDRGALPNAMRDLFQAKGLPLRVDMVYSKSMLEYYSAAMPDSVYLFNETYSIDDVASQSRHYHLVVPSDDDYEVKAAAVYATNSSNQALPIVIDELRKADESLAMQER